MADRVYPTGCKLMVRWTDTLPGTFVLATQSLRIPLLEPTPQTAIEARIDQDVMFGVEQIHIEDASGRTLYRIKDRYLSTGWVGANG